MAAKKTVEKTTLVKDLSLKKMIEQEHLQGKHKDAKPNVGGFSDCPYCVRGGARATRKAIKTKAFFAGKK